MKVILQKPIDKLGVPGDIIDVADGYARNYLMPRGIAVLASKGAVRHSESLKRAHGQRVAKAADEARILAERLASLSVKVSAKAGEEGKLFGSVTSADVAEAVSQASGGEIDVDRKDVQLDEPIRSLGVHQVRVRLHPEVDAELAVSVEASE